MTHRFTRFVQASSILPATPHTRAGAAWRQPAGHPPIGLDSTEDEIKRP
jgi:hypothetical protein